MVVDEIISARWGTVRIFRPETVHLPAEPFVVFRLGVDEAITTPAEQMLDGCSLAVSKSIAAKSVIM